MKITLKDGSSKEYAQPMSVYEIALDISEGLARVATAGEIDGEEVDLRTVVDKDCELNILTFNDEKGKGAFHHHFPKHFIFREISADLLCQNIMRRRQFCHMSVILDQQVTVARSYIKMISVFCKPFT